MTETVEKAKPGPKPKPAKTAKLAIALHRINGNIEPGTALALGPVNYKELLDLEAIREPNEGEEALFEKNPKSVVALPDAKGDAADDIDAALEG